MPIERDGVCKKGFSEDVLRVMPMSRDFHVVEMKVRHTLSRPMS